ncbi:hypothetical protein BpHYR1_004406, partial [Brachionus plicatilis]
SDDLISCEHESSFAENFENLEEALMQLELNLTNNPKLANHKTKQNQHHYHKVATSEIINSEETLLANTLTLCYVNCVAN